MQGASKKSNEAIAKVPGLEWVNSYVVADQTFCIYKAPSEVYAGGTASRLRPQRRHTSTHEPSTTASNLHTTHRVPGGDSGCEL